MGRPRKPEHEKYETPKRNGWRVSDEDWSEITEAAKRAGLPLVRWAMPTLLAKARRERKGKPVSRWNCPSCLAKLYAIKKYGEPLEAAKYESRKIRAGKLAPPYDKSFSRAKRQARSAS